MLRVTAYCRVSTDSDDQANSLANQEMYFKTKIDENPDWEYIPMYVDEGISGTSTKKRNGFNRMIADAERGLFDLVLTKEVSRFSRNTVDTLKYTKLLKSIGVGVLFTNNNIDSRKEGNELLLTIIAGIAQEESNATSGRVKWGQEQSMKSGTIFGQQMLGYDRQGKGKDATLVINDGEAEIIRLIFHKYLAEGMGLTAIARFLENNQMLTKYSNKRWDASAVRRILTNEKYVGDLVQKKFITIDFPDSKTQRNKKKETYITKRNTHPPIIDRETFDKVQQEFKRRNTLPEEGTRYSQRYPFSGKLVCGLCGAKMVNRAVKSTDGKRTYQRWRCGTSFKYGADPQKKGCPGKMVRNEILEHVYLTALRDMVKHKEALIQESVTLVMGVLDAAQIRSDHEETRHKIDRLNQRIKKFIDMRADDEITKDELQAMRKPLDEQIAHLNQKLMQLAKNAEQVNERETLLATIRQHITGIVHAEAFDGETAKETLDKIVVHGKERFDVYFKGFSDPNSPVCINGGTYPPAPLPYSPTTPSNL